MRFSDFKKEYKNLAKASTPSALPKGIAHEDEAPEVKRSFVKSNGFRFGLAAVSLLLAVVISLSAIGIIPFSKQKTLITAEDRPSLFAANSYNEIDKIFTEYKHSYNDTITYGENIDLGIVDENMAPIRGDSSEIAPSVNKPDSLYSEATPPKGDDNSITNDSEHSDTNLQTEGVDEADIIKTDGSFIFFCDSEIDKVYTDDGDAINSKKVSIFDVRDPKNIILADNIILREYFDSYNYFEILEMYLNDGVLTVLFKTTLSKAYYRDEAYLYTAQMGALVFDVSDPYNTKHLRTYLQEGEYKSSRSIGGYIYFVTTKTPENISEYNGDPESVIPKVCDSSLSNEYSCLKPQSIYITDDTSVDFNVIGAMSITDYSEPANVISVLGRCDTLYSSAKALYLCDTRYKNNNLSTDIYKFEIDGRNVTFKNSASVQGAMINQFAADEYNGYLRVATSIGYENNGITILNENLDTVGKLDGLAPGETIYSVRFTGDTGYFVTFRTVDPLFTFDLSDPTNPKVTGELKIPGYSEYLHPYNENTLIGIGQDANENDGFYQGLKISLFDVTDDFNPIEKHTFLLGDRGSSSELEFNHKALAYYPSRDVFGLPITLHLFPEDKPQSYPHEYAPFDSYAFYIFSANNGEEISVVNAIKQYDENGNTLHILRGIFIGDNVFTVSDDMLQSNDIFTGDFLDSEIF